MCRPSPPPPDSSPENARMRFFPAQKKGKKTAREEKGRGSLASLLHGHCSAGEGGRVGVKGGSLIGGLMAWMPRIWDFVMTAKRQCLLRSAPLFFHYSTSKLNLSTIALLFYTNFVSATPHMAGAPLKRKTVNFNYKSYLGLKI